MKQTKTKNEIVNELVRRTNEAKKGWLKWSNEAKTAATHDEVKAANQLANTYFRQYSTLGQLCRFAGVDNESYSLHDDIKSKAFDVVKRETMEGRR